jgi:AcrR family transcriptional regulator
MNSTDDTDRTRPRRRDPEAHRAAILAATREALTERGYARATIRDIARRAGVTHGLVMRHFGSKERLMVAALGTSSLEDAIDGDPAALPERLADAFVTRMETAVTEDPFVALIRSAATDERAAHHLYEAMHARAAAAYHRVLSGEDLDERIDLIGAQLIGITFSRYVVPIGALADMSPERLRDEMASIIRHILGPVLPGPQ